MDTTKLILVGKIVAPQGIRGDVRIQTYSESPDDFRNFNVQSKKFNSGDFKFIRVVPNSTVIIAHITGVDDRNTADTLRGTELYIDRDALPELATDEYYQSDLIGFTVVRDGEKIGTVSGFQNFGAGDIIETDNGDYISFIGANVDMTTKTILVK